MEKLTTKICAYSECCDTFQVKPSNFRKKFCCQNCADYHHKGIKTPLELDQSGTLVMANGVEIRGDAMGGYLFSFTNNHLDPVNRIADTTIYSTTKHGNKYVTY